MLLTSPLLPPHTHIHTLTLSVSICLSFLFLFFSLSLSFSLSLFSVQLFSTISAILSSNFYIINLFISLFDFLLFPSMIFFHDLQMERVTHIITYEHFFSSYVKVRQKNGMDITLVKSSFPSSPTFLRSFVPTKSTKLLGIAIKIMVMKTEDEIKPREKLAIKCNTATREKIEEKKIREKR